MKNCLVKCSVLLSLIGFMLVFCGGSALAGDYLDIARKTGITIQKDADGAILWTGKFGGQNKPNGPLQGKKIGVLAGL
jgi:hypothetical protein